MPALQVVHPAGNRPEREYVARIVFAHRLGLEHTVREGDGGSWALTLGDRTVTVEDEPFDTVFRCLTRAEEVRAAERDEHGRFPAEATSLDLDRPVADDAVELVWSRLREAWPRLERRPRVFRVVPSHDVDYPFASRPMRLAALRGGGLRAALPRNPFDTFDLLLREHERRGLRATFYFLTDGTNYSIDDPRIRALLRRVHEHGHEIGLHPSYETYRDPALMKSELDRLLQACADEGIEQEEWGARQHFLRWENPTTWRAYEALGLAHDATLGYSARPGFRAGTCHEYPVFDLEARRELALRERPLVLMDTPTLDRLGRTEDELVATIERLRDECRRAGGDFTVLWHNNWLVTNRQRRLFQAALGPADTS